MAFTASRTGMFCATARTRTFAASCIFGAFTNYPHIALMYYNLYRMRRLYPALPLSQSAETYLIRAARTLIAMFTIPLELDDWSAFGTGLYNELAAEDIWKALEKESMPDLRLRLERLWNRKAYKFAARGADVFGSEYPFDTTGFESTHALASVP